MRPASRKSCGRNCVAPWGRASMTCGFGRHADLAARANLGSVAMRRLRALAASLILLAGGLGQMHPARADAVRLATAAYARGDYVRAVNTLTPLALRGNA